MHPDQTKIVEVSRLQLDALPLGSGRQVKPMPMRDAAIPAPAPDRVIRNPGIPRQLLDVPLHTPILANLARKSRGVRGVISGMAGERETADTLAMAARPRKGIPGTTEMQLGFARRVLAARIAAGFKTQEALGAALGMKGSSVSNWERGLQMCHPTDMYRLAQLLGVTTDWLIAGDDRFLTMEAKRRLAAVDLSESQ